MNHPHAQSTSIGQHTRHSLSDRSALVLGLWVVMVGFGHRSAQADAPGGPPQTILEARPQAVDQVLASSRSKDPFLRANAIEAAQNLSQRVVPLVQLGLADPNPAVRFASAATVGSMRLVGMAPAVRALANDPSESVQAAALTSLRLCGEQVDLTPLAVMLTSVKPTVRGNAALLLGRMGDPSAISMLSELATAPMPRASADQEAVVRLQIAEAIVKLGDDTALNAVRAGLYSQFDEVRLLAVSMLGELKDRRMEKAMAQMLLQPPIELQIAALGALAQLGRYGGESILLQASRSPFPAVRAQTALTLGRFRGAGAQNALVGLLNDQSEQVRLSAAAGILQALASR